MSELWSRIVYAFRLLVLKIRARRAGFILQKLEVTEDEYRRMIELLNSPPIPSEKLREAARRQRELR